MSNRDLLEKLVAEVKELREEVKKIKASPQYVPYPYPVNPLPAPAPWTAPYKPYPTIWYHPQIGQQMISPSQGNHP